MIHFTQNKFKLLGRWKPGFTAIARARLRCRPFAGQAPFRKYAKQNNQSRKHEGQATQPGKSAGQAPSRKHAGQATVEYIVLLSVLVIMASTFTRSIWGALDKKILRIGSSVERHLKTGRMDASIWTN